MKVVHVATADRSGGAARAAHRLHVGLQREGHDSRMFVRDRTSDDPAIDQYQYRHRLAPRVRRKLSRLLAPHEAGASSSYEYFSNPRTEYRIDPRSLGDVDVINLHWIAGFVDLPSFFGALPASIPVVWTLHDMNPMTGGCHYDAGCGRFTERCGACPQLGSEHQSDATRAFFVRKAEALASLKAPLHLVADSHWLAREARRSTLLRSYPCEVIHYGLDTELYQPRDKRATRAALGIDADARILVFVAESIDNQRKGMAVLLQAIAALRNVPRLTLLTVGGKGALAPEGVAHIHLGRVDEDRLLSLVYSAADVFVIPSLQEAFGQTALEAMACGTPVVGFDLGGIPDMVVPGVTGTLVEPHDASALARALADLLQDDAARASMGRACRAKVLEYFTLKRQAVEYAQLYTRLTRASHG
ncbi:MAG TPA: glycosyltransferase [Polyangiaceae bacterium]|nr:glycosyltransferase [Polyangiaceae bacterium]